MRAFIVALVLLLCGPAFAQTGTKSAIMRHIPTGTSTVDQLCDVNRKTGACNPFATNSTTAGVKALPSFFDGLAAGYAFQQPDANSLSRARDARDTETVWVTDFCSGTQTNGTSNATTCVQAAVDARCNRTKAGGTIFFPAGAYRIDGTVNITCAGIELAGVGVGDRDDSATPATLFVAAAVGGSAPVFKAQVTKYTNSHGTGAPSPTLDYALGFRMHDMAIIGYDSGTPRTGPFVEMNRWGESYLNNLYFFGGCTAVKFTGGLGVRFSNIRVDNYRAGCKAFDVSGRTNNYTNVNVIYFDHMTVSAYGTGSTCFALADFVQTVMWSNTQCETGGSALTSACPNESSIFNCPGFFSLYDFEAESDGPAPGSMIDITDLAAGFKMTDSWLRGRSGYGGYANAHVKIIGSRFPTSNLMVNISSSWFKFAIGSCLYIESARTQIANNQIYGCNQGNFGAVGVELRSSFATVTGNTICGGDWIGDVTWRMRAGYIASGVDYTNWTGNVFSGDTNSQTNGCTAGIVNDSSGTHNQTSSGNVGP